MSLNADELKAMAAKVKAKQDPTALLAGCRFVRRQDPDDARFMLVEIRTINPAMANGTCDPVTVEGPEAVQATFDMCVDTARSAGMK